MASGITYEGAVTRSEPAEDPSRDNENREEDYNQEGGGIFAGQTLWFSANVPQRKWFSENAKNNGAKITELDTNADIIIFDPLKKNAPPGAVSYRYIQASIENGKLENVDDHRIASASRAKRPVGSVTTASKGSRNSFDDKEDQLLWNWIKPYMMAGGQWKGNEIYKHLEAINPRHTYQSWRDRWIKHTQFQNRQITSHVSLPEPKSSLARLSGEPSAKRRKVEASSQLSQSQQHSDQIEPSDEGLQSVPQVLQAPQSAEPVAAPEPVIDEVHPQAVSNDSKIGTITQASHNPFSKSDKMCLWNATPRILLLTPDQLETCWEKTAIADNQHTPEEWAAHFYQVTLPKYRLRHGIVSDAALKAHILQLQTQDEEQEADATHPNDTLGEGDDEPHIEDRKGLGIHKSGEVGEEVNGLAESTGDKVRDRIPLSNESRKRKHDHNSQNDFTQPQPAEQSSYSHHKSQDSQALSITSLPDIPYRTNPSPAIDKDDHALSPVKFRKDPLIEIYPSTMKNLVTETNQTSQRSTAADYYTINGRKSASTTQRIGTAAIADGVGNEEDEQSEAESDWIPPKKKSESPMFFPDHADDDHRDQDSNEKNSLEQADADTSQLNNNADGNSLDSQSSEDFETARRVPLSKRLSTSSPPRHNTQPMVDKSQQLSQFSARTTQMSRDSYYETAPLNFLHSTQRSARPSRKSESETDSIKVSRKSGAVVPKSASNPRHNDSISTPLVEDAHDFSIPPPDGGWSDDEDDLQVTVEVRKESAPIRQEPVAREKSNPQPIHQSLDEEDDIDAWLSSEKQRYRFVDHAIVDEICIKALEATSLQLSLATDVVEALITTYTKGKHPATRRILRFLDTRGRLRSPSKGGSGSMRTAVSTMIDELMPSDRQGVWTRDDDVKLTSTNARAVEEVERKHGKSGVRMRFEYLTQSSLEE